MENFILTFRIKADETYQDRYDSLLEQLYAIAPSPKVWEETSSFVAFEYSGSLDDVHTRLYLYSKFSSTKDTMVIIDLTNRRKIAAGVVKYEATLDRCLGF